MLCVLSVHERDLDSAIRNVSHALTLDGKVDFPCLIACEVGLETGALEEACTGYFSHVSIYRMDKWTGDPAWPQGPNWAWQNAARYIESSKLLRQPWLWWEPDAVPLKPGWLSTLAAAYESGSRPFAGPVAIQPSVGAYMAGVAIYPPMVSQHVQFAMLTRTQPWDVVASVRDGILRKTHDLSALICHTPASSNTHFESIDDVVRLIPESAVLFHKCKDGSLLDVLQGKSGPVERGPAAAVPYVRVPSFTEQTVWPSGYFTFPTATNTAYFNCSLADTSKGLHLFTRRERYNLEAVTGGALQGRRNDLAIWRIRDNMTLEATPQLPTCPSRYPLEQWEDPRAVVGEDGQVYVGFATWVHQKTWSIRQSLTRLSADWRKLDVLFEPAYGGNTPRPTDGRTHEKNWIWFQHDGAWHCQYSINPGDVFKVDRQGAVIDSWKTREASIGWDNGLPLRGGTPPVRLGDEYLAFFHTSIMWQKPKRRYYMGAYTFAAEPPFALKRITAEPLLVGSEHDFRALGGPLVIFPAGCTLRDGQWLVVFGVNDEACGWLRIPDNDLQELLTPVRRSVMERLAAAIA